jgi:hypothetical protein
MTSAVAVELDAALACADAWYVALPDEAEELASVAPAWATQIAAAWAVELDAAWPSASLMR